MSDMSSSASPTPQRLRPVAEFIVALRFLTRLPIPFARAARLATIEPQGAVGQALEKTTVMADQDEGAAQR